MFVRGIRWFPLERKKAFIDIEDVTSRVEALRYLERLQLSYRNIDAILYEVDHDVKDPQDAHSIREIIREVFHDWGAYELRTVH